MGHPEGRKAGRSVWQMLGSQARDGMAGAGSGSRCRLSQLRVDWAVVGDVLGHA